MHGANFRFSFILISFWQNKFVYCKYTKKDRIAAARDATPRQIALAFLTRRPSLFAIPKAADPRHAAENAKAGDLVLNDAEIALIEEAFPRGRRPRTLPMI